MIFDRIENINNYKNLGGVFKGLKFLAETDFTKIPVGKYELDGKNIYYMVQSYETKPDKTISEAHEKYIDIQYIVSGEEMMKVINVSKVSPNTEYNAEKDCVFFANPVNASAVLVQPGEYAIFFPEDIHMPGIAPNDAPAPARKIVVKVKV